MISTGTYLLWSPFWLFQSITPRKPPPSCELWCPCCANPFDPYYLHEIQSAPTGNYKLTHSAPGMYRTRTYAARNGVECITAWHYVVLTDWEQGWPSTPGGQKSSDVVIPVGQQRTLGLIMEPWWLDEYPAALTADNYDPIEMRYAGQSVEGTITWGTPHSMGEVAFPPPPGGGSAPPPAWVGPLADWDWDYWQPARLDFEVEGVEMGITNFTLSYQGCSLPWKAIVIDADIEMTCVLDHAQHGKIMLVDDDDDEPIEDPYVADKDEQVQLSDDDLQTATLTWGPPVDGGIVRLIIEPQPQADPDRTYLRVYDPRYPQDPPIAFTRHGSLYVKEWTIGVPYAPPPTSVRVEAIDTYRVDDLTPYVVALRLTYEVDGVYATDTVQITPVELTGVAWDTYFVEGQCEDNRPIELWTWGPLAINGVFYTPREDTYEFNGYRIFPEKLTYNDSKTEERKRVFVPASIHPAIDDVPVYFQWFDVDDPFDYQFTDMTAPGAPAFTWPEVAAVDNDDTGPDNCNKDQAVLSAATQPTNAQGAAKPYLKVGRFPGDNYRVVAALDQTRLSKVTQQNIEALGPEPVLGVQATPERLTVWRTLHLEFDSMEQGPRAAPWPEEITSTRLLTGDHAGETLLVLGDWGGDIRGRYEGGWCAIRGSSTLIPIVDNVPAGWNGEGGNLPASNSLVVPGDQRALQGQVVDVLIDDDNDQLLPHPINSAYGHSLVYAQGKFKPAFLSLEDAGHSDTDVPFYEDAGTGQWDTRVSPKRQLISSESFWACLVATAYQYARYENHDPDTGFHYHIQDYMDGDYMRCCRGISTQVGGPNICALFRETIRDWETWLLFEALPHEIETKGHAMGIEFYEEWCMVHEVAHLFGIDHYLPQTPSGGPWEIMYQAAPLRDLSEDHKPASIFYGPSLKTMRTGTDIETDGNPSP